jgi:hypothetical protein
LPKKNQSDKIVKGAKVRRRFPRFRRIFALVFNAARVSQFSFRFGVSECPRPLPERPNSTTPTLVAPKKRSSNASLKPAPPFAAST